MIEVDERIAWPKLPADIFPADNAACVSEEQYQQLKRLRLEADLAPLLAKFARTHVELIAIEADDVCVSMKCLAEGFPERPSGPSWLGNRAGMLTNRSIPVNETCL